MKKSDYKKLKLLLRQYMEELPDNNIGNNIKNCIQWVAFILESNEQRNKKEGESNLDALLQKQKAPDPEADKIMEDNLWDLTGKQEK